MKCLICFGTFKYSDNVYCTTCGHIFHYDCIMLWLKRNYSCAQCRQIDIEIHKLYLNLKQIPSSEPSNDNREGYKNLIEKVELMEQQIIQLKEDAMINESIYEHKIIELEGARAELEDLVKILKFDRNEYSNLGLIGYQEFNILSLEQLEEECKNVKHDNTYLKKRLSYAQKTIKSNQKKIKILQKLIEQMYIDMDNEKEIHYNLSNENTRLHDLLSSTMNVFKVNGNLFSYAKLLRCYGYDVFKKGSLTFARKLSYVRQIYNKNQVNEMITQAK